MDGNGKDEQVEILKKQIDELKQMLNKQQPIINVHSAPQPPMKTISQEQDSLAKQLRKYVKI